MRAEEQYGSGGFQCKSCPAAGCIMRGGSQPRHSELGCGLVLHKGPQCAGSHEDSAVLQQMTRLSFCNQLQFVMTGHNLN